MSNCRPTFRSDLIARPTRRGGVRFIELVDPRTGSVLRFSPLGYSIAYLMDGTRDLAALGERISADLGYDVPMVKLMQLVERLDELGCLVDDKRGVADENATVAMSPSQLIEHLEDAAGDAARGRDVPGIDAQATCRLRRPSSRTPSVRAAARARATEPSEPAREERSGRPANLDIDSLVTQMRTSQLMTRAFQRPKSAARPAGKRPSRPGHTPSPGLGRTPAPLRNRTLPTHVAASRRDRVASDPHEAVVLSPGLESTSLTARLQAPARSSSGQSSAAMSAPGPLSSPSALWLAFALLGAASLWASWALLRNL